MRTIGFVHSGKRASFVRPFAAIKIGLGIAGFKDTDYTIQDLWAKDNVAALEDHIKTLVAEDGVEVVIAAGGPVPAQLAQKLTEKQLIKKPVVFTTVVDPPSLGLVVENMTGMAGLTSEYDDDRMKLLAELLDAQPSKAQKAVHVMFKKNRPKLADHKIHLKKVAGNLKVDYGDEEVDEEGEIDTSLNGIAGKAGVVVSADSFFNNHRPRVVRKIEKLGVPAIYQWREFVEAGGLMSYGPSIMEAYVFAGFYAGRILNGEKPADIPLSKPTYFELVINQTTATKLGITIPAKLKARAEMID